MRKYTSMGLDELNLADHAHWIAMAEDGSRYAAKSLMIDAAICIQHGIALPELLAGYIGEALHKAATIDAPGGIDANTAFHLKKGRGRSKDKEVFKAHLICMEVQLAWLKSRQYSTGGGTIGAYDFVAEKYDYADGGSIARVFQNRDPHWHIKDRSREWLQEYIPMYRELLGLLRG